jgi:stalled ribosome alternative rescue factor ArfA
MDAIAVEGGHEYPKHTRNVVLDEKLLAMTAEKLFKGRSKASVGKPASLREKTHLRSEN